MKGSTTIVLGMHRSGTSLLARCLSLLGVELGPAEHLLPATKFNPTGFWEHEAVVKLNDEILASFGGTWRDLPALPDGWERDARLDPLREKAAAILAADFAGRTSWGFKDPRTCITLPFWKPLLPGPRYILCLRNPADVAHSLSHTMPYADGAALWLRYVEASLRHTAGETRILISYEELLADVSGAMRRLARELDLSATDEALAQAAEFARDELRHHRTSIADLMADERVPFAAKAVHAALIGHPPDRNEGLLEALARSACGVRLVSTAPAMCAPQALNLLETPTPKVSEEIGELDAMYRADAKLYFQWGEMALRCIRLAMAAARKTEVRNILDIPCGHGRALRYLAAAFPHARLTACDLDRDGVDFCARTFGAQPVYSDVDPRLVEFDGKFDLIWVGSLFTHLPEERWNHFLEAFTSWLQPGGLLVFSTHGREIARCIRAHKVHYGGLAAGEADNLVTEYEAHGFSFRPYTDRPGYGISLSSLAWICTELQRHPALQLVMLKERGWFNHHDAVACVRSDVEK